MLSVLPVIALLIVSLTVLVMAGVITVGISTTYRWLVCPGLAAVVVGVVGWSVRLLVSGLIPAVNERVPWVLIAGCVSGCRCGFIWGWWLAGGM